MLQVLVVRLVGLRSSACFRLLIFSNLRYCRIFLAAASLLWISLLIALSCAWFVLNFIKVSFLLILLEGSFCYGFITELDNVFHSWWTELFQLAIQIVYKKFIIVANGWSSINYSSFSTSQTFTNTKFLWDSNLASLYFKRFNLIAK